MDDRRQECEKGVKSRSRATWSQSPAANLVRHAETRLAVQAVLGTLPMDLRVTLVLRKLEVAALRAAYTQPGAFEWRRPGPPF